MLRSKNTMSIFNTLVYLLTTFWFICLIIIALRIAADWLVFAKAGQPGWAAFIPFLNSYIEFKIYMGNGWLFLVPVICSFLTAVPYVGWIFTILGAAIVLIKRYKQSLAFGQGIGFAIGLILFNGIFTMILGLGSYSYLGVPSQTYNR